MHYGPEKNLVRSRIIQKLMEMKKEQEQLRVDQREDFWVEFQLIPLTEPLRDIWSCRSYKESMSRGEYQRYALKSKFRNFRTRLSSGLRSSTHICTCGKSNGATKSDRRLRGMTLSQKRIFYGIVKSPESWRQNVLELAKKHPYITKDDPSCSSTYDWVIYDMVEYAHKRLLTDLKRSEVLLSTANDVETQDRLKRIEATTIESQNATEDRLKRIEAKTSQTLDASSATSNERIPTRKIEQSEEQEEESTSGEASSLRSTTSTASSKKN